MGIDSQYFKRLGVEQDHPTLGFWVIDLLAGTDIDKPEIALAVVLDGNAETEDGATGGKIAGPVAAQVIDAAVNQ